MRDKNIIVVKSLLEFESKCSTIDLKKSLTVYCRVSTKQQIKTESLNDQQQLGITYYNENERFNDYDNIIVFREEGYSGDDFDLNEKFLVKRKLFSLIISNLTSLKHIWIIDTNRIGRNSQIWSYLTMEFRKHSVLMYVNGVEKNLSELGDKFYIQLMGLVDEIENEKRFQRGLIGKLSSIRKGKWWGGSYQYGYKNGGERGEMIIDKTESEVVKDIFFRFKCGDSINEIISYLHKNNIKPPSNRTTVWNEGTLRNILRNEVYIGKKEYIVKLMKNVDKEECVRLGHYEKVEQTNLPKIVSDDLFYDVQKMMRKYESNIPKSKNQKKEYLLRHLLDCGHCGNMLKINSNIKRNIGVYHCNYSNKNFRNYDERYPKCGKGISKSINIKVVEELVWNEVVDVFKNSFQIKEVFKNEFLKEKYLEREQPLEKIDEIKRSIINYENKLKEINNRKFQFIEDYIKCDINENTYKRILNNTEDEIIKIEKTIIKKELEISEINNEIKWYDWLSEFDKKYVELKKLRTINDKRNFIDEHINKIEVFWDSITKTHTIKLHFKLKIVRDIRERIGKYQFEISEGLNVSEISNIKTNTVLKDISRKEKTKKLVLNHSTVTLLARLRGWSTLQFRITAIW